MEHPLFLNIFEATAGLSPKGDQDNILADEQHKQFLYLGVWAPWITILSMEY